MKNSLLAFILVLVGSRAQAQMTHEDRYIALHSGYGVLASDVSGSGFNADLPATGGFLYGFDFSFSGAKSATQLNLKYEKVSVEQTSPAGVTPSSVKIQREELRGMILFTPWETAQLEKLKLGLGYSLVESGATETSPNNLVTNQKSQGLVFNLVHRSEFQSALTLTSELLVYLPHKIKETSQVTGQNPNYIGAELKFLVETELANEMMGFVGLSYRWDQVSFDGTGTRGVTDGRDTRTLITVPVGIKMGF